MPGFCLVLHSHIPYCRQSGPWPHGEEWIHEAISETYLPLLARLHDLADEGVAYRLTLGITPVLAEQLADGDIRRHFVDFTEQRQAAAEIDAARFASGGPEPDPQRRALALWYAEWYSRRRDEFVLRFGGDLIGALRELADTGAVELMSSAATHGYLPLFATDEAIRAQVATGVRAHAKHFGRRPRSFWLPECAYRPAYVPSGATRPRPGLEAFLEDEGIDVFFVETHAIEGGNPVGKAAEPVVGYAPIPERELLAASDMADPTTMTTYRPYLVAGSGVAAWGRDNRTSMQVWSAGTGYPGDAAYREFHRKDPVSGLQYWRVTGPDVDLGAKALYDPEAARARIRAHAEHFAGVVADTVAANEAEHGAGGAVAMYDTELFGHWWFEGPEWLAQVLRELAARPAVELSTPVKLLPRLPRRAAAIPESSWGTGGTHHTWRNPGNEWMWPLLHAAESRMSALAEAWSSRVSHGQGAGDAARERILKQAGRELLLMQSSDWPFLIATGQAPEYAAARFREHAGRFHRLAFMAETEPDPADLDTLAEMEEQDNVFPDIDFTDWAADR